MSNDVYGYLEPRLTSERRSILDNYIINSSINIREISSRELFNYPQKYIPNNNEFIFDIADGPNSVNATYLIDYLQYDPVSADIGFPANPKERLDILLNTLFDMIKITQATKMIVSMTDCNQIETIKKIQLSEMFDVIHADFEHYQGPPDTLYEITC